MEERVIKLRRDMVPVLLQGVSLETNISNTLNNLLECLDE